VYLVVQYTLSVAGQFRGQKGLAPLKTQGVTERCRLSWLTNSALVYEPKCVERGKGGGCGVSANEYSCAHGAQIKFVDITPYLTYGKISGKKMADYVFCPHKK
jgi:hypothetical protein